ncbi:HD-GYP domain-containing protein [Tolumonas lignilytica]|jgi:HD-GYP domain|uniref:HD-GYP domain-containing protein n=1 Tax=Tolumonas lignilytica TaxID=1283284 RepID=UPI0004678ADB|nr:HD-GYP domain-containing protein [Tolumonas lignilytica]
MAELRISVDRLQIGNYIKLPLSWRDHPFLLSSFLLKKEEQIQLIRQLGLKFVFIIPEKSEAPPKPAEILELPQSDIDLNDEISSLQEKMQSEKAERIEKLKEYRRSLQRTEQSFNRSLAQMRALINKLQTRPLNAIREAHELVDDITKQMMQADQMVLHLMSDSPEGESLYYHSLNVAMLSMLLAKQCGKSEEEIKLLGMAAIFHDIGKIKIPSQILRKTEPLTKPEENLYKLHPRYSLALLDLAQEFPTQAKGMILKHHERLDGSGYPEGLKASQLDDLTQLMSVIDEYDSLCHPQMGGKAAATPHTVLSFMFKHKTKQLNKDYIGLLIKHLGIYPPGSVVELSNGQVGLVMSVNSQRLLYPAVQVYDPAVPRNEAAIIDLENMNLSIKRVLLPSRLPQEIFDYLSPRTRISYFFDSSNGANGS